MFWKQAISEVNHQRRSLLLGTKFFFPNKCCVCSQTKSILGELLNGHFRGALIRVDLIDYKY